MHGSGRTLRNDPNQKLGEIEYIKVFEMRLIEANKIYFRERGVIMENLNVDFKLVNQKVQFTAVSRSNPGRPVTLDYVPPLGDGQGFAGLELLLISFCGCVSTAVVAMLRKAGKNVIAYEGTAVGIRQENPLSLIKIIFEVQVKSDNIQAEDIEKALSIASNISPVWLAIKNNVLVVTEYKIQS